MAKIESANDSQTKVKSIVGLNFRQIVDSLDEQVNLQEGSNLYLVEDAFSSEIEKDSISLFNKIKRFFSKLAYKFLLVRFFVDISKYINSRVRVIAVLVSVLYEVIAKQFELVKKFMIRKMFWGRGNLFRFSLQLLGVFILVVVLIAGGYRNGVVDAGFEFVEDSPLDYSHQVDLIVQNSSTKTVIDQSDIGRIESVEYVVKGGDSPSSIAALYEIKVETLLWANDMTLGSIIKPGMTLKIPPADGIVVKVKKGDTLASLSAYYKSNEQAIADANWLDAPFDLSEGQELFLPDGVLPVKEQPTTIAAKAPVYVGKVAPIPASLGGSSDAGLGRVLGWPASGGKLSQCFSRYHNGVDIYGSIGMPLVAAAPGVVTFAGCQSGNCPPPGSATGGSGLAWAVIIDHQNGYSTVYGHMSRITVSSGQSVGEGQAIGEMGSTGRSTGPHVHFMLVKSGTSIVLNPAAHMKNSICGY